MNEQELREMKLHDVAHLDEHVIMRVVGGWIYTTYRLDHGAISSVFVPETKETDEGRK